TITLVSPIGYAAMAGTVGGGGVGDLAIRFGHHRYETEVMAVTVIALVVLLQVVPTPGDMLSRRANMR
ncbi:ABC transporter permease, partial [Pectobacterium carotovorum subsp. carotovorum]